MCGTQADGRIAAANVLGRHAGAQKTLSGAARRHGLLLSPHRFRLDPRLDWVASHAPEGYLIHALCVHEASGQAVGPAIRVNGSIVAECQREDGLLGWVSKADITSRRAWTGMSSLAWLREVSSLSQDELVARFGFAPNGDRSFAERVQHFCVTTATLIRHGSAFEKVDVVIASDLDTLAAGLVLSDLHAAPLIYDAHEYWPDAPPDCSQAETRFWQRYERSLVPNVDAAFTVSQPLARFMSQRYEREFVNVPNCEPLRTLPPTTSGHRAARTKVRFLYQGLFARGRGLEALIKLWPKTSARAELYLRGPHNEYSLSFRSIAEQTGLLNTRIFFCDPVNEEDLVEAARSFDVGVLAYEPVSINNRYCCPNKISQYCAAGLPLICNRLEYVESLIADADFGLAADLNDEDGFSDAVTRLAEDDDLRRRLASKAQRFFLSRFNWQVASRPMYEAMSALGENSAVRSPAEREMAFYYAPPEPPVDLPPEAPRVDPTAKTRQADASSRVFHFLWHRIPRKLRLRVIKEFERRHLQQE